MSAHRAVGPIGRNSSNFGAQGWPDLCRRLVAVAALTMLVSCASAGPRPGTGDVTFRLTWSGAADLDLYVLSPLDERVDFVRPRVDSGGLLDVDCNVGERRCPEPMENIYWPRRTAPPGSYKYWIVLANERGLDPNDTYRLVVLVHGTQVAEHTGLLVELPSGPLTARVWID